MSGYGKTGSTMWEGTGEVGGFFQRLLGGGRGNRDRGVGVGRFGSQFLRNSKKGPVGNGRIGSNF